MSHIKYTIKGYLQLINLLAERCFLTEMPQTRGFPVTPSNLIDKPSSPFTKAFKLGITRGLLAPTRAYMSMQETTYNQKVEVNKPHSTT